MKNQKRRTAEQSGVEVRCSYTEMVPLEKVVPHPRNPNRHPESQVRALARVIQHQGWRAPIVVSARSGFVISGHGRLEAARMLALESVPVDRQEFSSEADEWAHLVADNRIAELAEMDKAALEGLLVDLEAGGVDLSLAGFDVSTLEMEKPDKDGAGAGGAGVASLDKFEVVVECRDEAHQRDVFQYLSGKGEKCRLLTF